MSKGKKSIGDFISVGDIWLVTYDTGAVQYVMGKSIGEVCKKAENRKDKKADIIAVDKWQESSFSAN
jgi:hypothetical protein